MATLLLLLCEPSGAQIADYSMFNDMATLAARDKTDEVIRLLAAGNSPNITDSSGATPLHYAAQLGNERMAQALLYYKAPVDPRDQFGNTPLHWAAQRGSLGVLQLLIDAKAAVDPQNRQGMTPLMMAAKAGQAQAVRLLLKSGADPRRADFTGRDAMGWAEGKPVIVQMLRVAK